MLTVLGEAFLIESEGQAEVLGSVVFCLEHDTVRKEKGWIVIFHKSFIGWRSGLYASSATTA